MKKHEMVKEAYGAQEKEILQFIKRVRRRRNRQLFFDIVFLSLCISTTLAAILFAAALFIPILYTAAWGAGIILVGFLVAVIYSLFHFPGLQETAAHIDKTGLQERVSTCYERLGEQDVFSALLKQDTVSRLRGLDMKKSFPFRFSAKRAAWLFCSVMVMLICFTIWTPARETAKERQQMAKLIQEEKEKLEQLQNKIEKVQNEEAFSKEQLEPLQKLLEEAKQEAKEAESEEDLEKARKRLEAKAEQLLEQVDNKELLQEFGKALGKENLASLQQFKKQMSELAKENETVANAAETLKNLGEYLSEEEQQKLAAAMEEAQAAGNLNQDTLKGMLEELNNVDASVAASKLANGTLAQNVGQSGQGNNQNNGNGSNGNNNQNSNNGNNGNGSQSGNSGNNGQNGNSGQGGNGQNGKNGQGNSNGQNGPSGTGWDYGSKKGLEKEYAGKEKPENIFVSGREQGNDENLTGKDAGGKSYKQDSNSSAAWSGTKTDYNSVVGQYKDEALSSLKKGKIPSSMQDIVKSYFSSLE